MSRITDFTIVETFPQDIMVIEEVVSETEMIDFFVSSIMNIGDYIRNNGVYSADWPFMSVEITGETQLRVTVGTAVPAKLEGKDEIQTKTIPAGKKVIAYYQGDNAEMGEFYEEFESFIYEKGFQRVSPYYEYFLNGIEFGSDKLLTKVMCEIR